MCVLMLADCRRTQLPSLMCRTPGRRRSCCRTLRMTAMLTNNKAPLWRRNLCELDRMLETCALKEACVVWGWCGCPLVAGCKQQLQVCVVTYCVWPSRCCVVEQPTTPCTTTSTCGCVGQKKVCGGGVYLAWWVSAAQTTHEQPWHPALVCVCARCQSRLLRSEVLWGVEHCNIALRMRCGLVCVCPCAGQKAQPHPSYFDIMAWTCVTPVYIITSSGWTKTKRVERKVSCALGIEREERGTTFLSRTSHNNNTIAASCAAGQQARTLLTQHKHCSTPSSADDALIDQLHSVCVVEEPWLTGWRSQRLLCHR